MFKLPRLHDFKFQAIVQYEAKKHILFSTINLGIYNRINIYFLYQ